MQMHADFFYQPVVCLIQKKRKNSGLSNLQADKQKAV